MLSKEQTENLTEIFQTVFNLPELELTDDLTAKNMLEWDSFSHINLIVAVEEEFGIRFSSDELNGLMSVGDLKKLISEKLSSSNLGA